MNRIPRTFADLAARKEKALIGFITAGDPDRTISLAAIQAMCRAGLDLLELGVPFSDPTADGPAIQRSSARALAAGMDLRRAIEMAASIRGCTEIPLVLFSYYNPILAYGAEAFYRHAVAAGADGVLVVDLPPEESAELTSRWPGKALSLIRLTAPTTPPARLEAIAASASGFIYHVSKLGVTGSEGVSVAEVEQKVRELRRVTRLPVCVGFGISTPAQVAAFSTVCDGVVVGSAFERLIEENLGRAELPRILAERVAALKAATRGGKGNAAP
ncbi:MAG: tryptophan synthase subunit alpha [Desulfobacterales bacterium]|jgi:tryptophan synthase alpha chain|nr:tryptophan synthase subunit alpha [Desulfobacterales bacterium]